MVKPMVSIMLRPVLILCILALFAPVGLITSIVGGIIFVIDAGIEKTLEIISDAVQAFDYNQAMLLIAFFLLLVTEAVRTGWSVRFALWHIRFGWRLPRRLILEQMSIMSEDYEKLRRSR